MTGLELVGALGGVAATVAAGYVGLVLKPLEKDLEAEKTARGKEADAFTKRIDELVGDKKELEHRMTELEKVALTRSELDNVRRDMEASIDRMGDRVIKHFDDTTARLEKRIEKVEAA